MSVGALFRIEVTDHFNKKKFTVWQVKMFQFLYYSSSTVVDEDAR